MHINVHRALMHWTSIAALLLGGCSNATQQGTEPAIATTADDTLPPLDYAKDALWLCRPGLEVNHCETQLSVTELLPDGSSRAVDLNPETMSDAEVDCFYVYPTVDIYGATGNRQDFGNLPDILDVLLPQFGPFRGLCRQYAPLYRQITLGTYFTREAKQALENAYADVEAAFEHYLTHDNHGRDVVLIGHSQGAHMLRRLLQRRFEKDDALRDKLVVAMLIGPLGDVFVPHDANVGGTFKRIGLCTSEQERACVLTYNSFAAGREPQRWYAAWVPRGYIPACTNPVSLDESEAPVTALIPTGRKGSLFDFGVDFGADSDFVMYRDFYAIACVNDRRGRPYLRVSVNAAPSDQREQLLPFGAPRLNQHGFGLHILDFAFGVEALKEQLRQRQVRATSP